MDRRADGDGGEGGYSRANAWAEAWGRFRYWRRRRAELLAAEQERALEREAARARKAFAASGEGSSAGGLAVRWGLPGDEAQVAELLELNGMPRWVAFEERFVVATTAGPGGRVLAALRYRTESKRLVLGLLVADPWGGERRLAVALYAGAGDLAREMGAREVLAQPPAFREDYPRGAGYRRRGRYLLLDVDRLPAAPRDEPPAYPKAGGAGC